MYNNFNKKQKILFGIIFLIIVGFIYYYVYAKDEGESTQLQNSLEVENSVNQKDEEGKYILVHVSGAVNKEGVVELKVNSRISDAIEKARRNKRRCRYK